MGICRGDDLVALWEGTVGQLWSTVTPGEPSTPAGRQTVQPEEAAQEDCTQLLPQAGHSLAASGGTPSQQSLQKTPGAGACGAQSHTWGSGHAEGQGTLRDTPDGRVARIAQGCWRWDPWRPLSHTQRLHVPYRHMYAGVPLPSQHYALVTRWKRFGGVLRGS